MRTPGSAIAQRFRIKPPFLSARTEKESKFT
jgi:hypothetical protein